MGWPVTVKLDRVKFGQDICNERKRRGLGLRELARRLDMSPTTLCNIEHGKQTCRTEMFFQLLWWMQRPPAHYVTFVVPHTPRNELMETLRSE